MLYPKPLRRLIVLLAKLPGVGEKTATRLAFHMLKMTPESVRELGESIAAVPNAVIHCSRCFNIAAQDPCTICADPARRDDLLCVVENPTDLVPIEKSGENRGRYHVLGGGISTLDGLMPDDPPPGVTKPLNLRFSRITYGIPVGSDLKYTDEITVGRAIKGRRDV